MQACLGKPGFYLQNRKPECFSGSCGFRVSADYSRARAVGLTALLNPAASGYARRWCILLSARVPCKTQPQRDVLTAPSLSHTSQQLFCPLSSYLNSWPLLLKHNTLPKQNQQSFFECQQSYSLTLAPAEVRPQSASAGKNSSPPSDQQGSDSLWRGCLGSMCSGESPYQPSRPGLSRASGPHAAYKAGPAPEQLETLEMSHISKKSWRRGERKSCEAGKKWKCISSCWMACLARASIPSAPVTGKVRIKSADSRVLSPLMAEGKRKCINSPGWMSRCWSADGAAANPKGQTMDLKSGSDAILVWIYVCEWDILTAKLSSSC